MDPTPCSPVRGGAAGDAQGAGKWPSSLVLGTLTSSLRITSLNSRLIRDTAMFAMMILLFLGLSLLSSSLRYSPHCSLRSTFSFLRLSSSPRCSILPLFLLLAPVQFCGFWFCVALRKLRLAGGLQGRSSLDRLWGLSKQRARPAHNK